MQLNAMYDFRVSRHILAHVIHKPIPKLGIPDFFERLGFFYLVKTVLAQN